MRFQRGGPVCRTSTFFCLLFTGHVLKRIRLRIFPRDYAGLFVRRIIFLQHIMRRYTSVFPAGLQGDLCSA
jgi:hypothetical protein